MRKDSLNLKLKRGVFAGVSLLALAAVGCGGGGGGGTLVAPPALLIGNGAAPSVGKVAGASKALGQITNGSTIQWFDQKGELIDTYPNVTFPYEITIPTVRDTVLYPSALDNWVYSFRAFNSAGLDYRTVATITPNDLTSNGRIQEGGADRVEPTDVGSTVRTSLIEQQMSDTLGVQVKIGTETSEALRAQIVKAVATDQAIAVDELSTSLKESAKSTTTLLGRVISSVGASLTATTSISAGDAIRKLVSTGQNRTTATALDASVLNQLKKVRKVAGAMGRMARQIKRNSGNTDRANKLRTFLGNLGSVTEKNANAAASGAEVVANSLELATKVNNANLTTQVDNLINNSADVSKAAVEATTTVLTALDATVTQQIADAGGVGELSSVVSGVVAGASDANTGSTTAIRQGALTRALETVSSAITLIPGKENKDLFVGTALAASSDSTGAAVEILKTVASANANLEASERANVADAISSVAAIAAEAAKQAAAAMASAITNLGTNTGVIASAFVGVVSVDAVVGSISSGLSGDVLQSLKQSGIGANAILDEARISGGSANVKPGESVSLNNDSVETQDGTYTYSWAVTGNTGTVTSNDDSVSFTAGTTPESYSVVLSQRRNGAATKTATFNYSIASVLPPQITLSRRSLTVKKGGSGSLVAGIVDPETGRTITASASVRHCETGSTDGFTVSSLGSTGGTVSVTVASSVAAGTYCGRVTANPSNGNEVTRSFDVVVPALASTKVLVSGGGVFTEDSAALPISATAIQEQTIVTGAKFSLWVAPGSTRANPAVTGALTSGVNTLSTTVARTPGTYTIVAEVTNGTNEPVTISRSLVVNAVGAPTITSVSSNGAPVNAGDTLSYVITTSTLDLSVVVAATAASGSTIASSSLTVSGATTSNQVTTGTAAFQSVALKPGTNNVTVVVNSSENKSATRVFTVKVTQRKVITVSDIAISGGSSSGSLATTYANGAVIANASAVTGLDLNQTSGLQVIVSAAPNAAATGNVQITVGLTDAGSVRNASLIVNNAALVTSGTGWDVSSASTLVFAGQKTDGSTAQVSKSSSNVENFADLFTAGNGTLVINVDAMKAAMIAILGSNPFASSLSNLTGSNIGLEIKVSGDNFNFETSAGSSESFNTFRFTNITVQ